MLSTGVVRKIDALGRLVLPMELRKTLSIQKQDSLEFFIEGESIILRKYSPSCAFCSEVSNVSAFHGKKICENCLEELRDYVIGKQR